MSSRWTEIRKGKSKLPVNDNTKEEIRKWLLRNNISKETKVKGSYKFELSGNSIPYPKKKGKTLYVGGTKNLYRRLINEHLKGVNSSDSLQAFLNSNKRVYLSVKRAKGRSDDKKLERKEREKHISEYGMKAICDQK